VNKVYGKQLPPALPLSFTGIKHVHLIAEDEEVLSHALNYSQAAVIGLRNE
jgi:hypothetical protein